MKIAKVNDFPVWPFFTHDDLCDFLEWQCRCVEDDLKYLIRNAIPYNRWDHVEGTCVKSIRAMGWCLIMAGKVAPVQGYSQALVEYSKSLFSLFDETIDSGKVLCVNINGGFCSWDEDLITDIKEYDVDAGKQVVFQGEDGYNNVSTNIVIENDTEIDPWYTDNVKEFSYITSLKRFDETQLQRAFNDFSIHTRHAKDSKGARSPTTLWVHTQGNDWNQMQEYIRAAKNGYINSIKIHPSIKGAVSQCMRAVEYAKEIGLKAELIPYNQDTDNEKISQKS